jgi:hypothetical protein
MTRYPEVFRALAADFPPGVVKWRPQGGKQVPYISARVAMNRFDDVLGPDGWWDDYEPHEHSVLCKLTIRLPDGSTVTKQDAGGPADMKDEGDGEKAAYSDSFKRAAVKFGVGRILYGDGGPTFTPPVLKAAGVKSDPTPPSPAPSSHRDERTMWQLLSDGCGKYNDRFREHVGKPDAANVVTAGTLTSMLYHEAFEAGKTTVKPSPEMSLKTAVHHMEEVYANHRGWSQAAIKRLLNESYDEAVRQHAAPSEATG